MTTGVTSRIGISSLRSSDACGLAPLRRTLWMAGQVAILQKTNSFRDKFERYIVKDRHNTYLRRNAYTAIAAKMARTVHGIIKRGEHYRPFFEG